MWKNKWRDGRPRCCLEILKWMGWCLSASTSRWQQSVHHLRLAGPKSSLWRQISFGRKFFGASTAAVESRNVVKCSKKWFSRSVQAVECARHEPIPIIQTTSFVNFPLCGFWPKNKNEPRQLWAPDQLVPPVDGMLSLRFFTCSRVGRVVRRHLNWSKVDAFQSYERWLNFNWFSTNLVPIDRPWRDLQLCFLVCDDRVKCSAANSRKRPELSAIFRSLWTLRAICGQMPSLIELNLKDFW